MNRLDVWMWRRGIVVTIALFGVAAATMALAGVPFEVVVSKPPEPAIPSGEFSEPAQATGVLEPADQLIQRAGVAYNVSVLRQRIDSISEGTLTFFPFGGKPTTYPVTIVQKVPDRIQRVITQSGHELRQGSNGKDTWNAYLGFRPAATGSPLYFIESQTSRSVRRFLLQPTGTIRDAGVKGSRRAIEVEDQQKRITSFLFDPESARIQRIEFVVGETKHLMSGKPVPIVEAFEFSDFRTVDGVLTPFRIERYLSGIKTEEMQFDSVRYNTGVKDDLFRP